MKTFENNRYSTHRKPSESWIESMLSLVRGRPVTNASPKFTIVEYPKSGGSWLTNMVSSLCGLPARDLYVNGPEFLRNMDMSKHPWYQNSDNFTCAGNCVIKSHELPSSNLHTQKGIEKEHCIHLVRDGRDVVVSKWFYETEFLPRNGIMDRPEITFDDFLKQTAQDWSKFVEAWLAEAVIFCRYEDLITKPAEILNSLKDQLFLPTVMSAEEAVAENTVEKTRKSFSGVFKHNTFVRSARAGDWKNSFTPDAEAVFDRYGGDALAKLGYARSSLQEAASS
jgi:hypothetical protein